MWGNISNVVSCRFVWINTLGGGSEENGCHFADILNEFSWKSLCSIHFCFHWSLLLRAPVTISLRVFMWGLGAELNESIMINFYDAIWCHFGLIETEWSIGASVNYAIINSDQGLWPIWDHAIIWANANVLLTGPLGTNLNPNATDFILENYSENVVCKLLAILTQPHVNST